MADVYPPAVRGYASRMVWHPATNRRQMYRLFAIVCLGLAVGGGAYMAADTTEAASADLELGSLNTSDVNRTISGNVTGGGITADLAYDYTAPSANQIVVELKAGRQSDSLNVVTFRRFDVSGSGSGDVTMTGTFADAGIDALTLDPSVAGRTNTTIWVAATIRVDRGNGDSITHTVIEPVQVTLRDDATLDATVGGDVTVTIETSG